MRTYARSWRVLCVLFFGLSAASCAPMRVRTAGATSPVSQSQARLSDRLYFGRSIPGGGNVSAAEWADFLREVVTPRFPGGLTVWQAQGQWQDPSGTIVHEESFVLELIHPVDVRSDAAVEEIIAEYRRRFHQEAVLRVRDRVEVID